MSGEQRLAERIDALLASADPSWDQATREQALVPILDELTVAHRAACAPYARILDAFDIGAPAGRLRDVPWLPVILFTHQRLVSVSDDEVVKTLTSSGTTGQVPSRVYLDRPTAMRQTRALAAIMTGLLGARRRPMLIVDSPSVVRDPREYSARGAGILGMLNFGRDHTYVLDADGRPDPAAVHAFLDRHAGEPLLVFGFTFLVWEHLLGAFEGTVDLSQAVLVHSGGWKALEERSVDDAAFKQRLAAGLGLTAVRSFYGMVEQVGSFFLEGPDGLLHPPPFADVVVRDPETWDEQPVGEPGVVQVLSALPTSYPGHSLLTEDLGTVVSIDAPGAGIGGKAFRLHGRVPRVELRGCSDTHARAAAS
jgi:hypothetical protein